MCVSVYHFFRRYKTKNEKHFKSAFPSISSQNRSPKSERDEVGKYKERRLARSGTLTSAIAPMVFASTELNLKGRADLLPLIYEAHDVEIMVRPEHPVTKHAMTSRSKRDLQNLDLNRSVSMFQALLSSILQKLSLM